MQTRSGVNTGINIGIDGVDTTIGVDTCSELEEFPSSSPFHMSNADHPGLFILLGSDAIAWSCHGLSTQHHGR